MKTKNYLLIKTKVIKVGVEMNRVFPELAGKRVPWFSIIHRDEVNSLDDIIQVYLNYAYYESEGKFDTTPHDKVIPQLLEKWLKPMAQGIHDGEKETNVIPMRYAIKHPTLADAERVALQKRVSKDLGIEVNINLLLNTRHKKPL
ncbi:MAG TPA: hypothetical protein VN631_15370 [Negativicutes bacterium]|nr:hypothetical protein [Negativicutes bacterium]